MKLQINKNTIYQFIRFVIVGGINTILDLAVLNLLVYIFAVTNPFIFSVCKGISFMVAVTNSYFMNKYFTFAKKETINKDYYLFILISVVGLVINILISSFVFYLFSLSSGSMSVNIIATVAGIVGSMFSMVINYFCYSSFVFK